MKTRSILTFALVMMFQTFAMASVAHTSSGSTPCPLKAASDLIAKRNYSNYLNESTGSAQPRQAPSKTRAADTKGQTRGA